MKTSLENFKPLMRCAVCNRKHKPDEAVLLEEREDQTTFHITCSSCGVSSFVFVSTNQFGMMSMGILTDLERDEAKELFGDEAVSSDQVIDMHMFLKDFNGGVNELVKRIT